MAARKSTPPKAKPITGPAEFLDAATRRELYSLWSVIKKIEERLEEFRKVVKRRRASKERDDVLYDIRDALNYLDDGSNYVAALADPALIENDATPAPVLIVRSARTFELVVAQREIKRTARGI